MMDTCKVQVALTLPFVVTVLGIRTMLSTRQPGFGGACDSMFHCLLWHPVSLAMGQGGAKALWVAKPSLQTDILAIFIHIVIAVS